MEERRHGFELFGLVTLIKEHRHGFELLGPVTYIRAAFGRFFFNPSEFECRGLPPLWKNVVTVSNYSDQ